MYLPIKGVRGWRQSVRFLNKMRSRGGWGGGGVKTFIFCAHNKWMTPIRTFCYRDGKIWKFTKPSISKSGRDYTGRPTTDRYWSRTLLVAGRYWSPDATGRRTLLDARRNEIIRNVQLASANEFAKNPSVTNLSLKSYQGLEAPISL